MYGHRSSKGVRNRYDVRSDRILFTKVTYFYWNYISVRKPLSRRVLVKIGPTERVASSPGQGNRRSAGHGAVITIAGGPDEPIPDIVGGSLEGGEPHLLTPLPTPDELIRTKMVESHKQA